MLLKDHVPEFATGISADYIERLLTEGFAHEPFKEDHPDPCEVPVLRAVAEYCKIDHRDGAEFAHDDMVATLTDLQAIRFAIDHAIGALWKRRSLAQSVAEYAKNNAC